MLRPEPMSRVLVVGPKDQLEPVIETLHRLKLVHLVDHRGEDEEITIGRPLPKASEVSDQLVKLRSIASILKVEGAATAELAPPIGDLRQQIMTIEMNLREDDEARKRIESLVQDLDRRIEELRPFAGLRLPLEAYRGYDSIAVVVGRVSEDVRGLESVTPDHELVAGEGVVAVFAAKEKADRVRDFLSKFGFVPLEPPEGEGNPASLLAAAEADREKWKARLAEIEERIAKLRSKYAKFIVAAEDALQVDIEKAEAPLRFATSEHSFVIDGWVPSSRANELVPALTGMPGVLAEATEADPAAHAEAEPPVLLKHRGPVRRFEFLTKLYSTPAHDEVDPTAFLFVLFPIFFGLMIGDAGYGLVMIVLGFALSSKLKDSPDFADLMRVILYGGIFAFVFGLLLYGEIFGIPFHPPPGAPGELTWSAILGYDIPYAAPIEKLDKIGVIDLLLISIVASFVHLAAGYVVGFANDIRHNKRHAIAKVGWLLILTGFFAFFAVLGRTPDWCAAATSNPGCAIASHRVVNRIFFDQPPLAWIPAQGMVLGLLTIPWFMLGCILAGVALLIVGEPMGALEIISLLSNMVSYTRLAGVAVAKGAVALAFNTMLLPLILNEEAFRATGVVEFNSNIAFIIIGFVLLFLAHAMVLILGAISAGIQAIRLNYVEFMLKFFKGGGTLFSPFGARKKKTEA